MKKRGLKLLLLAIVMTFSFGLSAIVGASADGERTFAMAGASVRTNEPTGLRFEATVDKTTYESVLNDSNKTFGAFILPKDYLEAAEITEITDHEAQFKAKNLKYLNREDITGSMSGEGSNTNYILKYSIVDLHYYNYNRTFFGLFFIKTVDGDTTTYEYATVNGANNERSIAYVSNAAIEDGKTESAAYKFALKAAYLGVNGYDANKEEAEQNTAADNYFTENKDAAAGLYANIKAVAAIDALNVDDEEQQAMFAAAKTAYEDANPVLKAWVSSRTEYAKYTKNVTAFNSSLVDRVIYSINNLKDYKENTVPVVYSSEKYLAVAAEYDKLTEEQKDLVTNYAKLKAWTDAAAKVKLIYEKASNAIFANTDTKFNVGTPDEEEFIINNENIPEELSEYGVISRVWVNDVARNVRLGFKNLPDLTGYDVVRFPIYLRPDQVGDNSYNLVYKFKNESLTGGYRKLTAGWNIVTIPVSKMYEGIVIGANMIPAKTILHYAIPYAEKLENGDKISTFAYETNIANSTIEKFTDLYRANVSFDKVQTDEGNILKVVASKNEGNSGAGSNYAFRMNEYQEYKTIVADSGATGVQFKIYKKGTGGSVYLYMTEDTSDHDKGIKVIELQNDGWVTVSLTAEEFARWNGFFRKTWGVNVELYVTDFTIVK